MKTGRSVFSASSIIIAIAFSLFWLWSCASQKPAEKAKAGPPAVTLLPEDQVRLSNDLQKTEIFRDAGLGLFIHWGPNSQMGTEISWPLNNASDDYIKKYYALAETFNPVDFDAAAWARLAKLAGCRFTLKSVKTTPETQISVLSQAGGCEWTEDEKGLHINVSRDHTIQLIKNPLSKAGRKPDDKIAPLTWGPDWPIAVKITKVKLYK